MKTLSNPYDTFNLHPKFYHCNLMNGNFLGAISVTKNSVAHNENLIQFLRHI